MPSALAPSAVPAGADEAPWLTEVAPSGPNAPPASTEPAPAAPREVRAQPVPAVVAQPDSEAANATMVATPTAPVRSGPQTAAWTNDGREWDLLRPGDVLEVRFYRNSIRQEGRYRLAPGDVIRIDVVDHPEISREAVTVLPDGYISAPLAGSIEAAGKTVDEVQTELIRRYEAARLLTPDVSVSVTTADQRIDSLVRADPSGASPGMRISVSRMGDLDLPFIGAIPANRPLDEIQHEIRNAYREAFGSRLEVTANLVEHSAPVIYVAGQVIRPTEVPLVAPLTPVSAVAAAGGFLPQASAKDVHVIRFRPDGSYQDWTFNMDRDLKKADVSAVTFRLRPHDVVFVPKSGIAKADDFVEQYVRGLLPIPFTAGYGF